MTTIIITAFLSLTATTTVHETQQTRAASPELDATEQVCEPSSEPDATAPEAANALGDDCFSAYLACISACPLFDKACTTACLDIPECS